MSKPTKAVEREFLLAFWKLHILHHAEQGPVYGLEIIKELSHHGYIRLSPGTLYPTLRGLEKAGYLVSEEKLEAGRWRTYYKITPAGRKALAHIRSRLAELAEEVLRKP